VSQGVDYSSTGNADWHGLAQTLKANGKTFVGRYAVNDLSPFGRGIGWNEAQAMKDEGVGVFLYWEGHESWMLGGYDAGVAAAKNAEANRVAAGIDELIPIYFAHDIDPERQHFAAIDACLNGCASVIGWDRVGVYGGWLLIDYMAGGGTVKWLCQTSAWEYGRGIHPAAKLYQYAYNQFFYGTNCDLVQAQVENFGQTGFTPPPPPKPERPKARPVPDAILQGHDYVDPKGTKWRAIRRKVKVDPGTKFYAYGSTNAPEVRDPAGPDGMVVDVVGQVNSWYVTKYGTTFKIANTNVRASFKDIEK
jgi:hypothetical protein